MTSWKEIERIKCDPAGARTLAKSLLASAQLTGWEEPFLESMQAHQGRLSTRQAEKLVEIRDQNLWVSTIGRDFSVRLLLNAAWETRHDLNDEDDIAFIESLKARGASSARYREACRLLRCARELGVIDD
jgi:hypothetical protein